MRERLQGKLGLLVVGLIVGSLFCGVAVAQFAIPPHSVSYSSLTKGLQKRLNRVAPAAPGPIGPQGEKGATGPQGLPGTNVEPEAESIRAVGLVSPWADVPLSRSQNAKLVMLEDTPGIWCIKPEGIDPSKMLVQLTAADEPHVSDSGNEIPVVRWHVVPSFCEAGLVEIETAIYDDLEDTYTRTSALPFTFTVEEGG